MPGIASRTTSGRRCQWRARKSRGDRPPSRVSGRAGGGGLWATLKPGIVAPRVLRSLARDPQRPGLQTIDVLPRAFLTGLRIGRRPALFLHRLSDLVAAVDVFPYLVGCAGDLAQRHFLEACRVLVRGGSLLVLNYSYVHDDPAAAAEATALATSAGLQLVRIARNDFDLWDGRTFHFKRPEI